MSKFKKFISSLTVSALLVSAIPTFSLAYVASDVAGTDHEDAAKVLGALEIMVGDAGTGLFRPDDAIKRSEAAKVAVALKGLTKLAESSTASTKFPDVASDHWANGFINVGASEGLIIGDDVGTFRPDDRISYVEAVIILVRALGYEPQAIAKGGYPTGYITTASSIGLSKNVVSSATKLISRGDVAQLAYNALTIKKMEQVGFGTNVQYNVSDKTLLSDNLNVNLVNGVVTAVGNSSIDGKTVDKGRLMIDGKNYKTGNADVRNVLGFYVDAYITNSKSEKGRDILLVANPTEGQNSTVSISADNIKSITEKSGSKVIEYYAKENDRKSTSATINSTAKIVYNGVLGTWGDLAEIDSGSIVLLDTTRNTKYAIVFVNETVNYVVDYVTESSHRIIDKYNQSALTLDPDNSDLTYTIDKDNKAVDISELEEWDVITFTISKDKNLVYGTTAKNPVTGSVTAKSSDHYYIDDVKYKVASNYTNTIDLNDNGTFYLDSEGKIAAFDGKGNISTNYAYINKMAVESGLDGTLKFEFFNKNSELVTLKAANKIRVNDSAALNAKEALNAVGETNQLVTYESNEKGEVTKIYTSKKSDDIDEDNFTLNFAESGVEYKSTSSTLLAGKMNVKVDSNTLIFDIPSSAKNSDDYAVRDKSFFIDGGKYDVSVYDVKEDLTAGVIIVTNSDGKTGEDTSIAVVDKISAAKNSDGDTVEKLEAYMDGKKVSMYTSKANVLVKNGSKAIEAGDIVQLKTNSTGEIDGITLLFDINDSDKESSVQHSANMLTEYGKITKKFSNSFNFQTNDGAVKNYAIGNAEIYVVESGRNDKKISVGSKSDIRKYDDADPERVFVRVYKDEVKEIVIIR